MEPSHIVNGDLHVLVHKECRDNIGCQDCSRERRELQP
jgi:hypothetical protein